MLREKRPGRGGATPAESHRAFLLLFFLSGALIARFAPGLTAFLPEGRGMAALVLLSAILGGSVFGVYAIPVTALLFGALLLRRLEALGLTRWRGTEDWFLLLPPALLTLAFYAIACGGMRLAEECRTALVSRGGEEARSFFLRKLLLTVLAAGTAALYGIISI